MKYEQQGKLEILEKLEKGASIQKINKEYGIPLTILYMWIKDDLPTFRGIKQAKEYLSKGNYEEALRVLEKEIFKEKVEVQKLRMNILIKLGRLEEAFAVGNQEEFKADNTLDYLRIKILILLDRYEEALKIANKKEHEKNLVIQRARIKIYALKKEMDKALEIASSPKLLKDEEIRNLKNDLRRLLARNEENKKWGFWFRTKIVSFGEEYLRLIYDKQITLEEVMATTLDIRIKNILKMAYYERNGYASKLMLSELKVLIAENLEDKEYLKLLNILKERLISKRVIFDYQFYDNLIKREENLINKEKFILRKH